MTEALSEQNRALIGRTLDPITGHALKGLGLGDGAESWSAQLNRLLDAARSEGHAPERPMGELVERPELTAAYADPEKPWLRFLNENLGGYQAVFDAIGQSVNVPYPGAIGISVIAFMRELWPTIAALSPSPAVDREALAKLVYDSWSFDEEFVPWVERGNSDRQHEARSVAAQIIALTAPGGGRAS